MAYFCPYLLLQGFLTHKKKNEIKNYMDFKKFKKSNLFRKIMSEFDPGSE